MRRSRAGGLHRAGLAALAGLGCQEEQRPPLAADLAPPPPEPPSLVDPDEPSGPGALSPCGAVTARLEYMRPNLYFALDASGSMTEPIEAGQITDASGATPDSRFAALSLALEALLSRVGHRVNYGATLFPRGSDTCDSGQEIRALSPGDDVSFAVGGELGPELRSFMYSVRRRRPRGGTPVALALGGLLPELRDAGADTYVFLITDGGPNCASDGGCDVDTCIPNIEQLPLADGLSCDAAFNCCAPSAFGPENCLDSAGSVAAVRELAATGIKTFVIGIPGSERYADVLDALALAGGAARAEPPYYYRVGDADALLDTVSALGITVALSCSIQLAEAPPNPALVNLYFDGELVPSDPLDGWTFADETTVRVQGAACELLETGQVLQADLIAGCPSAIE